MMTSQIRQKVGKDNELTDEPGANSSSLSLSNTQLGKTNGRCTYSHEQEIFFASFISALPEFPVPPTPFAEILGFGYTNFGVDLSIMPNPLTYPPIPKFPEGTYIPFGLFQGAFSAVIRKSGFIRDLQVNADVNAMGPIPSSPSPPPFSVTALPLVITFVVFKSRALNDKGTIYGTQEYFLQPLQVSLVFSTTSETGGSLSATELVHGPGFHVNAGDRVGILIYVTGDTTNLLNVAGFSPVDMAASIIYEY